jgi:hypothetical protein
VCIRRVSRQLRLGDQRKDGSYEFRPAIVNVFIQSRPNEHADGPESQSFIIESATGVLLGTFPDLRQAVHWAGDNGHAPLVVCTEGQADKSQRDQWRSAYGLAL